jgi:aminopeptidase-like protein
MRTPYGRYREYHTSKDNKNFISFSAMEKSIEKYLKLIDVLEGNKVYINKFPNCEPQLGKRNLYPTIGSQKNTAELVSAMMWILNLSDGENDLLGISLRSKITFDILCEAADKLAEKKIIEEKTQLGRGYA